MTIIRDKFNNSKAFFNTHKTKNLKFRKQQLKLLSKNIKNHENELLDALYKDLGKSKVEAYATEIGMLLKSIKLMRKELKNWSKTKQTDTPLYLFPTKSYIKKEPYGTVLIIGPFNYPVQLVFEPLIGAIAAGNTAIVKPSELTPHVAIVIKDIIEDTFDEAYVSVVEGGIEETQALLRLLFDYMFFPVDDTANIKVASERISFGKFTNAGQTCVAPDYILVQRKVKNDLIKALKKTITEFYGENIEKSPDFGRIVNQKHFNRLNDLIQIHKDNVVFGGNSSKEDLYIEPTLLDNITNDNKIMKEEIFGPILPIITYDNFDEVLEIIQSKSKPLSLYLFSEDENMTHRVVEELSFGGGAINDTLMHLANPNLPFGGVGSSGIGQYHGKYSFDTFSHMKSYTFKSTRLESSLFFPPYKGKFKYIKTFFKN